MAITVMELRKTRWDAENGGFGYLGHESRSVQSDEALVEACNILGLAERDMFLWANSIYGRHLMDKLGRGAASSEFMADIEKHLPSLRAEVLAEATKAAGELGRQAFRDGRQCVPAHDPKVLPLLKSFSPGDAAKVLDGWLTAWHAENLKSD